MLKSASTDTRINRREGIIDCDVHVFPKNIDEIKAFMQPPFRDRYRGGGRGFFGNPIQGGRIDAKPPDGSRAASNPEFLREQLIDEYGIGHAVILPRAFCNLQPDPDFGIAIAAAYNAWLADTWLSKYNEDGCFAASISTDTERTKVCRARKSCVARRER